MSKTVSLQMKYKPGELNRNGWRITEEAYQKAEKELELSGRKIYLYNRLYRNAEPNTKDILGEVISREGSTYTCEIYDSKVDEFDNLISQGLQAGIFGAGDVSAKSKNVDDLYITGVGLFVE